MSITPNHAHEARAVEASKLVRFRFVGRIVRVEPADPDVVVEVGTFLLKRSVRGVTRDLMIAEQHGRQPFKYCIAMARASGT